MPSVIVNPAPLNVVGDARRLLGRDDEFAELDQLLAGVLKGDLGGTAILTGPVGCGKTQLAKAYAKDLAHRLAGVGIQGRIAYVDCRETTTTNRALAAITEVLSPGSSTSGWKSDQLARGLKRYLHTRDAHGIIIVDEVGKLSETDAPGLGYLLTRLNEGNTGPRGGITLILINESDFTGNLDAATRSVLGDRLIQVQAPTVESIEAILLTRAADALEPGSWDAAALKKLAKASHEHQDVRVAINGLAKAARKGRVTLKSIPAPEACRANPEILNGLDPLKRSVLTAVARASRTRETTTGLAEKTYQAQCRQEGTKPVGHTRFWVVLRELAQRELIESQLSGKGHAGTTQILNVPSNVRELLKDEA
jgi:Cdc6-like AAA superfamily ATPase